MLARTRTLSLAALALLWLSACGPQIRVSDSIDVEWDRKASQRYDNALHSPYVAGASFVIYAYDVSEDNALDGWTLSTADPNIVDPNIVELIRAKLDPDDTQSAKTDILRAEVVATGAGTVALGVQRPSGRLEREIELTVLEPDHVVLRAAGPLFIGQPENAPDLVDATPRLLANGLATFMVEWWAGDQLLSGTGSLALTSDNPEVINLETRTEHLDEQREWAQIEFAAPEAPTIANVSFYADGLPTAEVAFEIVEPSEIHRIELIGQNEGEAQRYEILAVLAQALDINGEAIWGVAFDWDINGSLEPEEGDIFRYWYDSGAASIVGAQYGEARAELVITGDQGFVESSNDDPIDGSCFCSTRERQPARGLALSLLSLLALGLVRRRARGQLEQEARGSWVVGCGRLRRPG